MSLRPTPVGLRAEHQRGHEFRRRLLKCTRVRVNVERDRDVRVTEALGDDLRVDARLERERRVGVAQVVSRILGSPAPFTCRSNACENAFGLSVDPPGWQNATRAGRGEDDADR